MASDTHVFDSIAWCSWFLEKNRRLDLYCGFSRMAAYRLGIMFFRDFLLQFEISFPEAVFFFGVLFVVGGVLLHSWTAKLLGIKATLGFTEIKPNSQVTCKIVVSGPFSVTRHPSYWAHTFILLGTFLISGIISVGVIVIIDLLIAYFITIELEEKELVQRFGDDYKEYKKQVPKFFPRFT